jgi:hypothetical protein
MVGGVRGDVFGMAVAQLIKIAKEFLRECRNSTRANEI